MMTAVNRNLSQRKHTTVDRHKVAVPADDQEKYDRAVRAIQVMRLGHFPWFDYSPDFGLFLGLGVKFNDYGFRSVPYRYSMQLDGGIGTRGDLPYKVHYLGDFRSLFSNTSLLVEAGTTGLDIINFYGLGNEKYYDGSALTEDDFEIMNQITSFSASLNYPMDKNYQVERRSRCEMGRP